MSAAGDLVVSSLAERPDLLAAVLDMPSDWPAYIAPDPLVVHWALPRHPEHQIVLLDGDEVVARAVSVPLAWDGDPASLPERGWDESLRRSLADTATGAEHTALCALEVAVVPGRRGQDLSGRALAALADRARRAGFRDVVVPVRPSLKHREPWLPMADYRARHRPDGLPEDPWLRVHARAGAEILGECPVSMTVSAGLAQWREWTGLPFTASGPVEVPGALAPVHVDVPAGWAVYVEPNVWVRHRLRA